MLAAVCLLGGLLSASLVRFSPGYGVDGRELDPRLSQASVEAIRNSHRLNAGLLYYKLRSHQIYQPQPGWAMFMAKILIASAVMGTILWIASGSDASWLAGSTFRRILRLAEVVAIGAAAYFLMLWLLGFRLKNFSKRGAP